MQIIKWLCWIVSRCLIKLSTSQNLYFWISFKLKKNKLGKSLFLPNLVKLFFIFKLPSHLVLCYIIINTYLYFNYSLHHTSRFPSHIFNFVFYLFFCKETKNIFTPTKKKKHILWAYKNCDGVWWNGKILNL